jgi:hypothetical protein
VLGEVVSWRGEAGAALGGGARQGGGSQKARRRPRCFCPKEEEGSGGPVGHLGWWACSLGWSQVKAGWGGCGWAG